MNSKITKRIGTPRRVFRNLDDISQFEEELREKERTVASIVTVETPVSVVKNYQKVSYYDPKTGMFTRVDPDDLEQIEYLTKKRGMIPGMQQLETDLRSIPDKLANDPKSSYLMETHSIIFEAKGKTPPSVPYLRVSVESSLGDENAIHLVHSKTKNNRI